MASCNGETSARRDNAISMAIKCLLAIMEMGARPAVIAIAAALRHELDVKNGRTYDS